MPWRLRVVHRTVYRYSDEVQASYNEARLSPLGGPGQSLLEHRVEAEPSAHFFRYRDYWGTTVHAFDVHRPHRELVVTGMSVVETSATSSTDVAVPGWRDLADARTVDRMCEYLAPSAFVEIDDTILAAAEGLWATTPAETLEATVGWLRDHLTYERGATTVSTTAAEVLVARHGVCQDFAHLAIALLRAQGIPARYMSGYHYPNPEAPVGETYTGESHAWLEAWVGEWRPVDPTNSGSVGERHVLVGHGRDYGDVPPLKGIFHGGPTDTIVVTVEATRLA
jgi:transglutaminase-like putative cysteine protease